MEEIRVKLSTGSLITVFVAIPLSLPESVSLSRARTNCNKNSGRVPRLMETLERASKTVKFSLPLRGLQFKHELREHRDFLVA